MLDPLTTACFTGHRPQRMGGFNPGNPVALRVRKATAEWIWQAYRNGGYRTFISGMALGYDQMAAKLVLRLRMKYPESGVRLVAAVPCEGQDRKWSFEDQREYRSLLSQADLVHVVVPGPFETWKLHARNNWMVDQSSLVIAAWDGKPFGGTHNCMWYAYQKGVPVWITRYDEENITCYIGRPQ